MISELNPSIKLDTNSPTIEDRHLFVHKSLYIVVLHEDCGWTAGKTLTSSPYTFWAGKTLRNQGDHCFFPRVTESKFSYFLGNNKQKGWVTVQTMRKCWRTACGSLGKGTGALHGHSPWVCARQTTKAARLESRTGRRDPPPLIPRARAHL